jgi:A/G-specific adenine glycosylase
MKSFPTVDDLAAATEDQVNAHWAGLGFYRRARLLHKGAKHVCFQLDGKIPETVDELLELPGVGRYTASAIASIAFDQPVAVVDGNVCRVLSRLTGIANHIKAPALKDKLGWGLANQLLEKDEKHAGEINQALMELGATYCAPNGTGIDPRDPLRHYYKSRKLGKAFLHYDQESSIGTGCELCDPNGILAVKEKFTNNISSSMSLEEAAKVGHATFPLNPPKTKKREEDLAVFCCSCTNQQGETFHLLQKRAPKGLLAGQWEFPNVCIQTRTSKSKPPPKSKVQKTLKQYLQEEFVEDDEWITQLDRTPITSTSGAPLEHIFSHVKHIMWIESSTCANMDMDRLEFTTQTGQREVRWMQEQDMKQVGITSGVKKILKAASTASKKKIATKRKRKR